MWSIPQTTDRSIVDAAGVAKSYVWRSWSTMVDVRPTGSMFRSSVVGRVWTGSDAQFEDGTSCLRPEKRNHVDCTRTLEEKADATVRVQVSGLRIPDEDDACDEGPGQAALLQKLRPQDAARSQSAATSTDQEPFLGGRPLDRAATALAICITWARFRGRVFLIFPVDRYVAISSRIMLLYDIRASSGMTYLHVRYKCRGR